MPPEPTRADIGWWERNAPPGMVRPTWLHVYSQWGYNIRCLRAIGPVPLSDPSKQITEQSRCFRAGIPLYSLGAERFEYTAPLNPPGYAIDSRWLITFENNSVLAKAAHSLPLRPLWPGFAINTLFYAAILWVLFAIPTALRRRWRLKRNLCPGCRYPIGTSPLCTECGAPLDNSNAIK